MNAAIEFHDKTPLRAAEVNNVLARGVLAAELETLESESPQYAPSCLFGFSFVAPKLPGVSNLRLATGERATLAIRSGWLWVHGVDPLTRPETADENVVSRHPLPQGGEGFTAAFDFRPSNFLTLPPRAARLSSERSPDRKPLAPSGGCTK